MSELGFGNMSDFELKIVSLGPLLVWFLVEIWSHKSLILRFPGLIFSLAALDGDKDEYSFPPDVVCGTSCPATLFSGLQWPPMGTHLHRQDRIGHF